MTILIRLRALALPLALTLAFAGGPLHAEEAPAILGQQAAANPYADLYDAMQGGIDNEQILDNMIQSITGELVRQVPEFELLEAEKPGLLVAIGASIRPHLADYSSRVKADYHPRMVKLFQDGLTPEEAGQLTDFYRSDMGRKLLAGVSTSYTGAQTLRGAMNNPEGEIPAENISNDIKSASIKAYLGLSLDERKALEKLAAETPAFTKLNTLQPRINALRHEMENAPMLPEEEVRLQSSMEAALQKHLGDLAKK